MTLDARTAESAPTRRSSRPATTPVPASEATVVRTRAEIRRRTVTAQPAAEPAPEDYVAAVIAAAATAMPAALDLDATPVDESTVAPLPDAAAEAVVAQKTAPAVASRRSRRASSSAFGFAAETPTASTDSSLDDFERAARLFAFTGETPVQVAAAAIEQAEAEDLDIAGPAQAGRRRWRISGKRMATASFSVGVMTVVGLLAVGMTTPAGAVTAGAGAGSTAATNLTAAASTPGDDEIQAYVASADVQTVALERTETYSTATMADLAAASGVQHFDNTYVNNPTGAIQWPFPVGVPYSWGFVMRDGRQHEGVDFTPGEGAEIHAIADGTVRIATESGGGYGVTVLIDHIVDGELVSSRYGHMLYGSLQVSPGEKVTVGQVIGRVGNTGHSFGAHLHFEILQNGTTAIDPLPWMHEHTGG